jgi:hypothetical protein
MVRKRCLSGSVFLIPASQSAVEMPLEPACTPGADLADHQICAERS